ncbi:MAG: MFS transporter, partial [Candidatus Bathyarchaeia archaeon]
LTVNVFYMGLTSLLSDLSHEMATAILPFFLTLELGAGPEALGLIEGLSDGASSLTKSFSGYWSDKMGRRKPLMNLGYALTALLKPMIAFTKAWPQVLVLRIGAWTGRGIRGPPRDALLADSTLVEARGKAFGFQRAMDTVGATLGPALALLLIPFLGYREVFLLSAIPGLAAFLVVLLLVKETRVKRASTSIAAVSSVQQNEMRREDLGYIASVRALPRRFKLFLVGVGIFGLGNFANSLFALRAQQVLAPKLGALQASAMAVGLYTLMNLVYAASSLPVGALSDRAGRRGILALGYFISAATCLGAAFLAADLWLLIPVFLMAGFFTAITDTVEGAAAADLLPHEARGTGYGALQTVNGVGDFVSSAAVGTLWTLASPLIAFSYAALLSGAGGAVLLYLTRGYPHIGEVKT